MLWLLAALPGLAVGFLLGTRRSKRAGRPGGAAGAEVEATNPPELAWVVRANDALGIWLRRSERGELVHSGAPDLSRDVRESIEARLPAFRSSSGSTGAERLEAGTLLFVSGEDLQVALLLRPGRPTARATDDLEYLVTALRTQSLLEAVTARKPSANESLASVAIRMALEIERLLDAEVAIAVRRPRGATVIGTALRADPHLHRALAAPGSPVDLCVRGELKQPVIAYEPLGVLPSDRRHRERRAYVAPIPGAEGIVGAMVAWLPGGGEPAGHARAELERALSRGGTLLDDATQRLELTEQATRDPLTGLSNRRGLEKAMSDVSDERGAVICLDLDHFKSLNDSLGHPAGDAALGFVSRIITETVRDRDIAARIGGEEFAVWLPGATGHEAEKVAERLRTRIAGRAWGWKGRPWPITASFGVASWPETSNARENLVTLADRALYDAKRDGRNRVRVWKNA